MLDRRILTLTRVVCATFLLLAGTGSLLAEGEEHPEMSDAAKAEMNAWMKLAQPGEHHEHLGKFVGKWNATNKMWMQPGEEPMVTTTKAEAEWILGGRYLQWHHIGDFGGMAFEGIAIEAYDNGAEQYEGTWIDNMGTLIIYFTGHCSDDGMKRETIGSFDNPMSDGNITMRNTIEWKDEDHFTYVAYMDYGGGEAKHMEMQYERASD